MERPDEVSLSRQDGEALMGIFAQPLELVHYAEKECWSDWDPSVVWRYR